MVRFLRAQGANVQPDQSRARSRASQPEAAGRADFRDVFQLEFDYVWHTLRRLGVPERDLADVTHDVFERVYLRLDRYDKSRPLRPWLFGFAFRVAADYRRLSRNRCEQLGLADEPHDPRLSPAEELVRAERVTLALAALDSIEFERRAVFVLHELDDYPIPEVAEALGINVNTAYSRLRLAREEFRRAAKRLRAQQEAT
ncbi:MAG TPA: RNA polymerase sigma factor [Polyangiaceae bacterium]|nr:RNA polymerase sigma factor [Polyangiaceae bacterium]